MIGPSFEFLINFGARFTPCMREVPSIPLTQEFPCLNVSTKDVSSYTNDELCPLWEICGLENASSKPNQSYRFVTPMVSFKLGKDTLSSTGLLTFILCFFGFAIGLVLTCWIHS